MKYCLARIFAILMVVCAASLSFAQSAAETSPEVGSQSAPTRRQAAYLLELQQKADRLELDAQRPWHTLMHYRGRYFGGVKSDVDSATYFLSEDGKFNPRAELQATLAAFFEPAPGQPAEEKYDPAKEHPQCRFQARYQWLNDILDFDPARLPVQPCPHFKKWADTLGAESATLIFAASYINNPASMFGHTMLRLDRRPDAGSILTSYVVSFAAEPWTTNPFLYTVLGLTGGFDARFSVLPFYVKTHEYSAMENRDLWEYHLDLKPDEFQRMIEHIWEIQANAIDYYYLDENCSFHLLALLEVARPSLRMSDQFIATAIPSDTLRQVLDANGLNDGRHFRHAQRREMLARREALTPEEVELAGRLGHAQPEGAAVLAELQEAAIGRQVAVLDAAIALWDFNFRDDSSADKSWKYKLLAARGRLKERSPEVEIVAPEAPEEGHDTAQVSAAGGVLGGGRGFFELGFRPALHDLGASDVGYAPLAQIEFLDLRLRATNLERDFEDATIILERLDLLDIISLSPLDIWIKKWSWAVKTGFERTHRTQCPDYGCLTYDLVVGFGGTLKFGPLALYSLLDAEVALGSTFAHNVRLAAGPRLGALLELGSVARVHLEGRYRYAFLGEEAWMDPRPWAGGAQPPWSARMALSFGLSRNVEARLNAVEGRLQREAGASVHVYW